MEPRHTRAAHHLVAGQAGLWRRCEPAGNAQPGENFKSFRNSLKEPADMRWPPRSPCRRMAAARREALTLWAPAAMLTVEDHRLSSGSLFPKLP